MNKYSKEFKEQALQLSDEIDTRKASEDLGISYLQDALRFFVKGLKISTVRLCKTLCVKHFVSHRQAITSGNEIAIR